MILMSCLLSNHNVIENTPGWRKINKKWFYLSGYYDNGISKEFLVLQLLSFYFTSNLSFIYIYHETAHHLNADEGGTRSGGVERGTIPLNKCIKINLISLFVDFVTFE